MLLWSSWLPQLPRWVLLVLLFLGTLVAVGRILLSVFMGADPMGPVGVALLLSAAAGMEVFISSLFADGYVALDRHTHVMSTALMVAVSLLTRRSHPVPPEVLDAMAEAAKVE